MEKKIFCRKNISVLPVDSRIYAYLIYVWMFWFPGFSDSWPVCSQSLHCSVYWNSMYWTATVLLNVLWICVQDLSSISYENKSALAYETLNPALFNSYDVDLIPMTLIHELDLHHGKICLHGAAWQNKLLSQKISKIIVVHRYIYIGQLTGKPTLAKI